METTNTEVIPTAEVAPILGLDRLVQALAGLPRVMLIYERGNDRVRQQILQAQEEVTRALEQIEGPLVLEVRNAELQVGAQEVDGSQAEKLARSLQRRGIRRVSFEGAVSNGELADLGELLGTNVREIAERRMAGRPLLRTPSEHITIEVIGAAEAQRDLDKILADPEISGRMEEIRSLLGHADPLHGEAIDILLSRYLRETGNQAIDATVLAGAVRRFLTRLRGLLEEGSITENGEKVRHTIWNLLSQSFESKVAMAATEEAPSETAGDVRMAYEKLDAKGPGWAELAAQSVRRLFDAHDTEANAFLVCCEMRMTARTPRDRTRANDLLRTTVASGNYGKDAILEGARKLAKATDSDSLDWDLVDDLLAHTADPDTVAQLVQDLGHLDWHSARRVVDQIASRKAMARILTEVLNGEPSDALRREIVRALATRARRRPESWLKWGMQHAGLITRPNVLRAMLDHQPEILAPIVRGILSAGTDAERQQMISLLVRDGQLRALRLLVLGVPYGDQPRDVGLLNAFGAFRHPLAVAMLREAVHRSNTKDISSEEGVQALEALHRSGTREARAFLQVVASQKCFGLPAYRRVLRKAAREALAGGGSA